MFNLSDKELDRLSREASEKFEAGGEVGSWSKLEKLLDKELGRPSPAPKFRVRARPFLYAPAALLLIGSIYYLTKTEKHTSNSTQKNIPTVIISKPAVTSRPPGQSNQGSLKEVSSSASGPVKTSTSSGLPKETLPEASITNSAGDKVSPSTKLSPADKRMPSAHDASGQPLNLPVSPKHGETNLGRNIRSLHEELSSKAKLEIPVAGTFYKKEITKHHSERPANQTAANSKYHAIKHKRQNNSFQDHREVEGISNFLDRRNQAGSKSSIAKQVNSEPPSPQHVKTLGIQPLFAKTSYNIPDTASTSPSVNGPAIPTHITKNKTRALVTNRSLVIGLLFSPDFSKVRYNYENKIGSNIGVTVGYQLNSKLLINSGLIFSHKNFNMEGNDFHCPPSLIGNIRDVEFVEGSTRMLEIPLNLRYDFVKDGNTSLFFSGGFSSYYMKKENYLLFYHGNWGGGFLQSSEYSYQSNRMNWFPVLNASIGFETKISNSFSFQLEPYMKIPLTGVGVGNVNLSSYGFNAYFQFAPILKRSRR